MSWLTKSARWDSWLREPVVDWKRTLARFLLFVRQRLCKNGRISNGIDKHVQCNNFDFCEDWQYSRDSSNAIQAQSTLSWSWFTHDFLSEYQWDDDYQSTVSSDSADVAEWLSEETFYKLLLLVNELCPSQTFPNDVKNINKNGKLCTLAYLYKHYRGAKGLQN